MRERECVRECGFLITTVTWLGNEYATYTVTTLVCYVVGLTLIWVFHHGVLLLPYQFCLISTFPSRQCNNQNKVNPTK